MSSICSGSIHLRIKKYEEDGTDDDGDQADETKLSVGKIGEPAKRVAPGARSDQRQQSLEHQHQRTRCQERFRHRVSPSAGSLLAAGTWRALGAAAGLLQILEELGARIE